MKTGVNQTDSRPIDLSCEGPVYVEVWVGRVRWALLAIRFGLKQSEGSWRIFSRNKNWHAVGEPERFVYGVDSRHRFDTGSAQTGRYNLSLEWLNTRQLDETRIVRM